MSFVKIHQQILYSSVMELPPTHRLIFILMLTAADKEGHVYGTIPSLARSFNVPEKDLSEALEVLAQPDPDSTSPDEEGRRVIQVGNNLYFVVNYLFYRGLQDPAEERRKTRERVRKHRERKKLSDGNAGNKNVTQRNDNAEADKRRIEEPPYSPPLKGGKKKPSFVKPTASEVQAYLDELGEKRFSGEEFVDGNEAKGWLVGKTRTPMKDWKATVRTWRRFRDADHNGPPRPVDQTDEMTMTFRRLAQKFGCTAEDMKAYWDKEGATPTTKEQVDRFLEVPF